MLKTDPITPARTGPIAKSFWICASTGRVRQAAAGSRLLVDDAVPGVESVRGGHVVGHAAVPVDVRREGELERQSREAGHRHAVPRVVGEIAEAVDEVVRVDS